jgi:hypothetical protein
MLSQLLHLAMGWQAVEGIPLTHPVLDIIKVPIPNLFFPELLVLPLPYTLFTK